MTQYNLQHNSLQRRRPARTKVFVQPRQAGAALIVSLIFLLVMTIVTTSGMRTTTLEEKMAGNMRDKTLSFQNTEATVREGEVWLGKLSSRPEPCMTTTCSGTTKVWGRYMFLTEDPTSDAHWASGRTNDFKGRTEMVADGDENPPKYILQHIFCVRDSLVVKNKVTSNQDDCTGIGRDFYRLLARSAGGTTTAESIIETTFTRRF